MRMKQKMKENRERKITKAEKLINRLEQETSDFMVLTRGNLRGICGECTACLGNNDWREYAYKGKHVTCVTNSCHSFSVKTSWGWTNADACDEYPNEVLDEVIELASKELGFLNKSVS